MCGGPNSIERSHNDGAQEENRPDLRILLVVYTEYDMVTTPLLCSLVEVLLPSLSSHHPLFSKWSRDSRDHQLFVSTCIFQSAIDTAHNARGAGEQPCGLYVGITKQSRETQTKK